MYGQRDTIKTWQVRAYYLRQLFNALFFIVVLSDYLVLMRMQSLKYDIYENGCYFEIIASPNDFDSQVQWYKDFNTFFLINLIDYPITFVYYSLNILFFDSMHITKANFTINQSTINSFWLLLCH